MDDVSAKGHFVLLLLLYRWRMKVYVFSYWQCTLSEPTTSYVRLVDNTNDRLY